ncbi:hypothetical protein [Streptomyces sp. NPDC014623]|uniref:hypothetical protein n=1 Tax=Streptomyces sp. NPDC014623 TaxID=3364875 RepID=UPI0036FC79C2
MPDMAALSVTAPTARAPRQSADQGPTASAHEHQVPAPAHADARSSSVALVAPDRTPAMWWPSIPPAAATAAHHGGMSAALAA